MITRRLLSKEAVTYEDMRDFLERTKNNPNIIRESFSSYTSRIPKPVQIAARMEINSGPSAFPKRTAKALKAEKELGHKIFMPEPEEVPHLYGDLLREKDDKTLTALQGYILNHEQHELKESHRPASPFNRDYGHRNLFGVLGRSDNNFVATASDEPTRKAAKIMMNFRQSPEMEYETMKKITLSKFKPLERNPNEKTIPGIKRLSKIEKGEKVSPLQTEEDVFELGKRKISRKEALARYYKEIGIDPNYAFNPHNHKALKLLLKEKMNEEAEALRKEYDYYSKLWEEEKAFQEEMKKMYEEWAKNTEKEAIQQAPKKKSLLEKIKEFFRFKR